MDNALTFASAPVPIPQSDAATRYPPTVQPIYCLQITVGSRSQAIYPLPPLPYPHALRAPIYYKSRLR
jgi:hypothetical protein